MEKEGKIIQNSGLELRKREKLEKLAKCQKDGLEVIQAAKEGQRTSKSVALSGKEEA